MNANVERLYRISNKPERMIIGLMSGTSVDGLDVAVCRCKGSGTSTQVELVQFETLPYGDDYREEIRSVFSNRSADLQRVCLLNGWVAGMHAAIVNDCLQKWRMNAHDIDLIASHGQTIYHAPQHLHGLDKFPDATLQIGDGDRLAVDTGVITISDFRQKNIAAGGEGAPLAAYGDYLVFSKQGEDRIMLNIGGIANFTFLPGDLDRAKVFSTDTGPGNTLMDAFVQENFPGLYFDEAAAIALRGSINSVLLEQLKDNDFFERKFPKTTGPELFNKPYVERAIQAAGNPDISAEDLLATLTRFSADTIVAAIGQCRAGLPPCTIYTSGGGIHNPLLMKNIAGQLPGYVFKTTGHLQVNPDAKEAVLFALLANETVAGEITATPGKNKNFPIITMGKISFPH